jgi:hypothetical protein
MQPIPKQAPVSPHNPLDTRFPLRPERINVSQEPFLLQTSFGEFQVLDYSPFGLSFICHTGRLNTEEFSGTLLVHQIPLGSYAFKVVRQQPIAPAENAIKVGMEVNLHALPTQRIEAILAASKILSQIRHHSPYFDKIPHGIKLQISQVLSHLKLLEGHLLTVEEQTVFNDLEDQVEFETQLSLQLQPFLKTVFEKNSPSDEIHLNLSSEEQDIPLSMEVVQQVSHFFQLCLGPLFEQAPILNSQDNPLSIISKMESLTTLEQNALLGQTLFGKALSHFFLQHSLALAIKDRAYFLFYQFLEKIGPHLRTPNTCRILALEPGTAFELQMLLKHFATSPIQFEITILDTQLSCLKRAQLKLKDITLSMKTKPSLKFHQLALGQTFSSVLDKKQRTFDIIYSPGLLDTLSDEQFLDVLETLHPALTVSGLMIFGTFDTSTSTDLLIQLAFNPRLTYRSSTQLTKLLSTLSHLQTQLHQESGSPNCFTSFTLNPSIQAQPSLSNTLEGSFFNTPL